MLLPDAGDLIVPPHLRVLHISQDPLFFQSTLFMNLIYGTREGDSDRTPDRVQAICKRLRISPAVFDFLDPGKKEQFEQIENWRDVLSLTQRVLLNLARALVSNPEVLIIHKPTLVFDDDLGEHTFDVLREFVDEKCLVMDPAMWSHRRPRTCVATTVHAKGIQIADKVFEVSRDQVREIDRDNIPEALLR